MYMGTFSNQTGKKHVGQIDDLRDALEPLLATALSHHTTKLPLLDKAKLYVLVTYAIESLLFCTYGPPDTAHI